jgi:hypothetical protein
MKPKLLLLGLLALLQAGCGFVFTKGPPTGHEQMLAFSCTESDAGPILDIVWAGLNVLGALTVASDPSSYEDPTAIEVSGVAWGVFSSFSAASGFKKAKQCRAALQQLAERNAQRASQAGVALPTDLPSVAVVVVSPADDSVRVGEQRQLVATAQNSSGTLIPNREFRWSSSNDAVASVNNAGLVSAHAAGTVVIAANTGNVVGTARIVVTAPR